jgi:hypothetical protein
MQKSYESGLATHIGPESCGAARKGSVEAFRALSRRSQNGRVLWDRMRRLLNRWLPLPTVCHPYPLRSVGVVT